MTAAETQEDNVAKGQVKGNREKKKPKADKSNSKIAAVVSPFAPTRQAGKTAPKK
jgi:hypothetical protein